MAACPHCRAKVNGKPERCPSCGEVIPRVTSARNAGGRVMSEIPWPNGNDGQPIPPAALVYVRDEQQLCLTTSLLAACEIPSVMQSPNPTFYTGVLFGTSILGAQLFVPETRLEEALEIINTPYEEADEGDKDTSDEGAEV